MDEGPKVVAVTGISGYIGRELADQLDLDESIEKVVGLDIAPYEPPSPRIAFLKRSVTEPFDDVFLEHRVDTAVHLAFCLNPVRDRAVEEKVNIGGTKNFLDACAKAKVKTVLVASSATAYGAQPDNPPILYEGAPLRATPDFPYAWDKARLEELCYEFAKQNPQVCLQIIRPCVVIGPHASNFLSRMLDKPVIFGVAGYDPPIQFVHEDDVVRAIHRLLKSDKVGVFNIAADGALPLSRVSELAGRRVVRLPLFLARAIVGLAWKLGWTSVSEAPPAFLEFCRYPWCISNVKLKTELGFLFKYDGERAVLDFIDARAEKRGERRRVRVEVDADELDELESVDRDLEGVSSSEEVGSESATESGDQQKDEEGEKAEQK